MRPTANNPSPSAPPIVQSNSHYSGPSVQMPQPFGSGIGFKSNVTNTYFAQNPPMGYQSPPTGYQNPSMGYPSPPQNSAPYPNYTQAAPPTTHYQNYAQIPQNYQVPQANFPVNPTVHHNVAHRHYPQQTLSNMYPNLNKSVPFSYAPSNPTRRSTSDYMRKVIVGRFRQLGM